MAVLILANIVHGDNIGMDQVGYGMSLLLKAVQKTFVVGQAFVHHLDGHQPPQRQILCLVDNGHAAAANALQQFVTAVQNNLSG